MSEVEGMRGRVWLGNGVPENPLGSGVMLAESSVEWGRQTPKQEAGGFSWPPAGRGACLHALPWCAIQVSRTGIRGSSGSIAALKQRRGLCHEEERSALFCLVSSKATRGGHTSQEGQLKLDGRKTSLTMTLPQSGAFWAAWGGDELPVLGGPQTEAGCPLVKNTEKVLPAKPGAGLNVAKGLSSSWTPKTDSPGNILYREGKLRW